MSQVVQGQSQFMPVVSAYSLIGPPSPYKRLGGMVKHTATPSRELPHLNSELQNHFLCPPQQSSRNRFGIKLNYIFGAILKYLKGLSTAASLLRDSSSLETIVPKCLLLNMR